MAQGGDIQNDLSDGGIWPLSSTSSEAADLLNNFWPNVEEEVNKLTNNDFKNQELPLARIKKIMKLDDDVKLMMISAEAPVLFAKAAEMFINELTLRAWIHTEDNKRRTLQRNDIAMAVSKYDQFDFLIDIVPREELKPPPKRPTGPNATISSLPNAPGTISNAAGGTVTLDAASLAANGTTLVGSDQVQYFLNQAALQQQQAAVAAAAGQQIQLMPQTTTGFVMTTGPNGQPQLIQVQVPQQAAATTANANAASSNDLTSTGQTVQSHPVNATTSAGTHQLIQLQSGANQLSQHQHHLNASTVNTVATANANATPAAANAPIQLVQNVMVNGEVQQIPLQFNQQQIQQMLRMQLAGSQGATAATTATGQQIILQSGNPHGQYIATGANGQQYIVTNAPTATAASVNTDSSLNAVSILDGTATNDNPTDTGQTNSQNNDASLEDSEQ